MLRLDDALAAERVLLRAMLRNGIAVARLVEPRVKDPTSQLIIESLMMHGVSSVSRITDYVRDTKGSSSRTTVRAKIEELQELGVVARHDRNRGVGLTDAFFQRYWYVVASMLSAHGSEKPARPTERLRRTLLVHGLVSCLPAIAAVAGFVTS